MTGEALVNAIADTIERTLETPQAGSMEFFRLLVTNLRETAASVGNSEWEDYMGESL